jgi:4-amino-4-deoxy-L-arabinose transferase-like glycosyltransferase
MPMAMSAMSDWRRVFLLVWLVSAGLRLAWVLSVPVFGDEAFYAWEARHLAWAYSDLPGLTAWLIALGTAVFGESLLGLRIGALLLGLTLPWVLLRIADALGRSDVRYQTGVLATVLPLLLANGVLALPEPSLLLAAMLSLWGGLRLLQQRSHAALAIFTAGLVVGAFSHYRFAAVVAAGAVGMLVSVQGRALLRWPPFWVALALGAAAWLPLWWVNADQSGAGLRFQLVERHPWRWHWDGLWYPVIQALVTTPLVWIGLWLGIGRVRWRDCAAQQRLLLAAALIPMAGYGLLGMFADNERVSFHWPLVGYLAALPLFAALLVDGRVRGYRAMWLSLSFGTLLAGAWMTVLANSDGRSAMARWGTLADNFSGWTEVASWMQAIPPKETRPARLIADNFMLGAQLRWVLPEEQPIWVLDHPLNHKHGRAAQLQTWGIDEEALLREPPAESLLVVEETALKLKDRLAWQHRLCSRFPGLRWIDELQVNRGRKRFLMFRWVPRAADQCSFAPLLYVDQDTGQPDGQARLLGWAIADGVGVQGVALVRGDHVVAEARYGRLLEGVQAQWPYSTDPMHPHVGFELLVPKALDLDDAALRLRVTTRNERHRDFPLRG